MVTALLRPQATLVLLPVSNLQRRFCTSRKTDLGGPNGYP
ncbi:unnamed protein product [Amoebophrya sp. A25]|nr:unnamed protein product [Amoebophrya sp. A25]|eukprot:GSA25T00009245001.1